MSSDKGSDHSSSDSGNQSCFGGSSPGPIVDWDEMFGNVVLHVHIDPHSAN